MPWFILEHWCSVIWRFETPSKRHFLVDSILEARERRAVTKVRKKAKWSEPYRYLLWVFKVFSITKKTEVFLVPLF